MVWSGIATGSMRIWSDEVFSVLIRLVDSWIIRPQFSSIIKSMRLAIIAAPCDVLCELSAKSVTSNLLSSLT